MLSLAILSRHCGASGIMADRDGLEGTLAGRFSDRQSSVVGGDVVFVVAVGVRRGA